MNMSLLTKRKLGQILCSKQCYSFFYCYVFLGSYNQFFSPIVFLFIRSSGLGLHTQLAKVPLFKPLYWSGKGPSNLGKWWQQVLLLCCLKAGRNTQHRCFRFPKITKIYRKVFSHLGVKIKSMIVCLYNNNNNNGWHAFTGVWKINLGEERNQRGAGKSLDRRMVQEDGTAPAAVNQLYIWLLLN